VTTKNFVVKNGLTTGNIILDAVTGNITANVVVANLSVPATANLGAVGNIKITGGTTGQVLSTDGTGNLSWETVSSGSSGTGIYVDTFSGNGVQANFTLSSTPSNANITLVNYNGALQLHNAYTLTGNIVTMSEAPASGSTIEVITLPTGGGGSSGGAAVGKTIALNMFLGF
jgi:hypothetical protein